MRYIDADKIPRHGKRGGECYWQEIEQLPTADVVEVVRCKDCKYGEVDDADFPDQYFCNQNGCDWNEGNHFCSYGEREEQ